MFRCILLLTIGQTPGIAGVSSAAQSGTIVQTGPISSVGVTQSAAATAAATAGNAHGSMICFRCKKQTPLLCQ